MTNQLDPIGEAGLRFFGRMSASISHELKNALAIIKENAGLLDDYIHMTAKGAPVDPDRFRHIAQRIDGQTHRADAIIKNLNLFAHTVDSTSKAVDLNLMLDLLVALHRRLADMRQVTIEPRTMQPAVVITTAPFILLNAIGMVLDFVIQNSAPGAQVSLAMKPVAAGAEICFASTGSLPDMFSDGSPIGSVKALLTALGAEAIMEAEQGRIIVKLPLQP